VKNGREYSLHFTDLSAGMPAVSGSTAPPDLKKAVEDLKNIFKKK